MLASWLPARLRRTGRGPQFASGLVLSAILALPFGPAGCASPKPGVRPSPIGHSRERQEPQRPEPAEVPVGIMAAFASSDAPERAALKLLAARAREEQLDRLAREALSRVDAPDNDLGLVFVIAERASDLPWVLVLENRGAEVVKLAASPALLGFAVVPPAPAVEPAPSPLGEARPPASKKPPTEIRCGAPPSSAPGVASADLLPGQMLVYAFDPRELCSDPDVLTQGARIEPRYGWPIATKKVWRQGKMVEEVPEQKPPFAAELPQAADSPLSSDSGETVAQATLGAGAERTPARVTRLKHLSATAFVLNETYPLDAVHALPAPPEDLHGAAPDTSEATAGVTAADAQAALQRSLTGPPPPPLSLTVRPLGTTSSPDGSNVTVTVRNTSQKSVHLFIRRELLTFELSGPSGVASCQMEPKARAPNANAFSTLAPGGALSLVTRLAEACPKDTFAESGAYSVSARFDAENDGAEFGLGAYVGVLVTRQAATFTVNSSGKPSPSPMRILSRTPAPSPPASAPTAAGVDPPPLDASELAAPAPSLD